MERWWEAEWQKPRAFLLMCEALADTCRRVREYEAVAEIELGRRVIHADIKPRNVFRAVDGRWLLTDFGASKSRSVEDTQWAATRMILGMENFIAPEALFNARKPHPAAMDTWSLGCTLFALLRMRAFLKSGARMPPNGTHAHHFRCHRVALVGDLQQRKPNLFADRDLDPAQFTSPEKLPDKDRKAVAEALEGIFGDTHPTLEGVLATETLHLLDRAFRIDPALRFRDPLEMAGEFEALAQRFRELDLRAGGGSSGRKAAVPAVGESTGGATDPVVAAQSASAPVATSGASAPRVLVSETLVVEEVVVEEGNGRRGVAAPQTSSARVPPWIGLALLCVLGIQVVQLGVSIAGLVLDIDGRSASPEAPPTTSSSSTAPAFFAPPPPVPVEAAAVPVEVTSAGDAPAEIAAPISSAGTSAPRRVGTPTPPPSSGGPSGLVMVSGAQAYLMGPSGRMPLGSVSPGSYELFTQMGASTEFDSQGSFQIAAGERVVYRCGLGTCKRLQ